MYKEDLTPEVKDAIVQAVMNEVNPLVARTNHAISVKYFADVEKMKKEVFAESIKTRVIAAISESHLSEKNKDSIIMFMKSIIHNDALDMVTHIYQQIIGYNDVVTELDLFSTTPAFEDDMDDAYDVVDALVAHFIDEKKLLS